MPKIDRRVLSNTKLSSGFSLIELIIVILIASLFAAFVFNTISFGSKKNEKVGILKLKEAASQNQGGDAELVCIEKCKKCFLIHNGKESSIGSQLKPLKAYILDDSNNPQEIDFGRFRDKKVCLRFMYYSNGSNSQMILESDDKFYFIPSYFGKIEAFGDLDEAVSRWTKYRDKFDTMGTYY